jgi:hypothetical protein
MASVLVLGNRFAIEASNETFHHCVDASMSSGMRRIDHISQDERINLPDDTALQAATDLLV